MELITSLVLLVAGYYAFMFLFNVVIVPIFMLVIYIGAYVLHVLRIIRLQ